MDRERQRYRDRQTERETEAQTEIQRQGERPSEREHSRGVRRCHLELVPGFSWPSSGDHWSLGSAQGTLGSLLAASLQILDTFSLSGSSSEGSLGSACWRPWCPGGPGSGEKAQEDRGGRQEEGRASATSNPASARYPRDGVPAPRQPTARVTLVSPRILRQPRHCYHPPLPRPNCPGDGTKGREAKAMPKEA